MEKKELNEIEALLIQHIKRLNNNCYGYIRHGKELEDLYYLTLAIREAVELLIALNQSTIDGRNEV